MDTRKYKTKEAAQIGFERIVSEWPTWLNMREKLWIVESSDGYFRLQDYSPIHKNKYVDEKARFVNMKEYILNETLKNNGFSNYPGFSK